ncbi:MAG: AAA family ATPase [Deltaproteobacteria bacterium RIFOXYA12_FULL_61_11]|nr:MAG: AAA family ATPase [Deltaproteobacteria bacterium RIFOXYA12_FULL_61_11]
MFERTLARYLIELGTSYPVLTMTGPRQSGKTTLCRACYPDLPYRNLEDPEQREWALSDPKGFLATIPDGAVLDELQRVPELLSSVQVHVDEPGFRGLFVLTGSQHFALNSALSQSLAGRSAVLSLLPLSLGERPDRDASVDDLIFTGGYPRLHDRNLAPHRAMADYVATYLERDLRQLSMVRDLGLFQRFVRLCSGRIGQLLNLQHLAADTGVSQQTARQWLTLLEASYLVFRLPPFHANLRKRLVKMPKLYFHDTGLACYLLGIEHARQLATHPLRGALFENLVIGEVLKSRYHGGKDNNLSFYRDSNGTEVDLLYAVAGQHVPVEIKAGSTLHREFWKGILRWREAVGEQTRGILVYTGELRGLRDEVVLASPRDMLGHLHAIAESLFP